VVTKNVFHIESIDVGAVQRASSHSYVQPACFRSDRPLLFLPDSGRVAIGDPRFAPPNQCAAEVAAWACSPEESGPALLDVAYALLVRVALCPRHRQAGNGNRLASQGIPALLDMEEPPWAAWATGVGERDSRAHPLAVDIQDFESSGLRTARATTLCWSTARATISCAISSTAIRRRPHTRRDAY
jgi:hypothetical protein